MDKYGVVVDDDHTKTAGKDPKCPECGSPVDTSGNVPRCPKCGTKPFEKKEG